MNAFGPVFALAVIFVALSATMQAQEFDTDITTLRFSPTLTLSCPPSDYTLSLPFSAPDEWRDFRGIIVEEMTVEEIYPLFRTLFFDAGEFEPPERYRRFTSAAGRHEFSDVTIPGGTIQKYHQILNIIGFRMREYPETGVELACGYTNERGESAELAEERGRWVREYLIGIWGIDPDRVRLSTVRELRCLPSDTLTAAESRYVRFESDDWELCRPVHPRDVRRFYSPDSMYMQVDPLLPVADVANCSVEFFKNGRFIFRRELHDRVNDSLVADSFHWLEAMEEVTLPGNLLASGDVFSAHGVVTDVEGKKYYTRNTNVPVRFLRDARSPGGCRMGDRRIDRFTLPLLSCNNPDLDTLQRRIIAEYCYPAVPDALRLKITGYADARENDSLLLLSKARGDGVADHLRRCIASKRLAPLVVEGVGSTQPLYSNDLPEGRCYNRTVQIIIESRRDDRYPWE